LKEYKNPALNNVKFTVKNDEAIKAAGIYDPK